MYETLFDTTLEDHHNAIADARATALCFFELMKRGEITDEIIARQNREIAKEVIVPAQKGCLLPMLIIISITLLTCYL